MAIPYSTPGVHFEQVSREPRASLSTGVPVFLGSTLSSELTAGGPVMALNRAGWTQLDASRGTKWAEGYLPFAVRGFFENGGARCYVVGAGSPDPGDALALIDALDDFDLVCAPELALSSGSTLIDGQMKIIEFCEARSVFAVLDSIGAPSLTQSTGVNVTGVGAHHEDLSSALEHADPAWGGSAALYAPWVKVQGAGYLPGPHAAGAAAGFVPPCGHVAGMYASADQRTGVFMPPANQALEGVLDLELYFDDDTQVTLDPMPSATAPRRRINCLRAFPGRGTRIWGAGTLSRDSTWTHINVRRLALTIERWFALQMRGLAFEPNNSTLRVRITAEVSAFLERLYDLGAFKGKSPERRFTSSATPRTTLHRRGTRGCS
ncbi:Phage tail sheath protein FI [Minicystis rosea]|nr:Phage tail sheath protein FI [Minicystis rosea]